MKFVDFCYCVEPYITSKRVEFRKAVAEQITYLKIKPQQYDDVFDFADIQTGFKWNIQLKELVRNFRQGKGDLNRALAFYYLFHNTQPYFPAARNLDEFLFGEEKDIDAALPDKDFSALPSVIFRQSGTTKNQQTNKPVAGDAGTSAGEIMSNVRQLIDGNPDLKSLYYRLDYSNQKIRFVFDPEKFRGSKDEEHLDDLLYALADAGGVLRRANVSLRDAILVRDHVIVIMSNPQVHAYLKWIHTPDQLPDHVSFLDAVYLYESLSGKKIPELTAYRIRAEEVLKRLSKT